MEGEEFGFGGGFVEFCFEIIEEERVDEFHDVAFGGVVCSDLAAFLLAFFAGHD